MSSAVLLLASLLCGTSPETHQQTLALEARVRSAPIVVQQTNTTRIVNDTIYVRADAETVTNTTRIVNDTIYVRADAETAPFDDPADLEGISLYFARRGPNTFALTREPLRYDDDTGPLFAGFGRGELTKALALPFAFPFGDVSHQQVTISAMRGVHFSDRPAIPAKPFGAIEAITGAPLISPLFDYQNSPGGKAIVFVKQSAEAVTITFRREFPSLVDYDLQAVLSANGDIRFSYRHVQNIAWGGVVVTTGGESWMSDTAKLATFTDAAGTSSRSSVRLARCSTSALSRSRAWPVPRCSSCAFVRPRRSIRPCSAKARRTWFFWAIR
jgi:hypothetical protein